MSLHNKTEYQIPALVDALKQNAVVGSAGELKPCECGEPTYGSKCSLCMADEGLFTTQAAAAEASINATNAILATQYFEVLKKLEAYEKNGVTCQTYRHFVDTPCTECNSVVEPFGHLKATEEDQRIYERIAAGVEHDAAMPILPPLPGCAYQTAELERTFTSYAFQAIAADRALRQNDTDMLIKAHAAMQKFVDKVDSGRARSVETYKEFKELLSKP